MIQRLRTQSLLCLTAFALIGSHSVLAQGARTGTASVADVPVHLAHSTTHQTDAKRGAKTFRLYTVGNSVTDTLKYDAFPELFKSRDYAPIIARQMIPGAPLEWLWAHPSDGFKTDPYGYPASAFANYAWDAVSLQPFDRQLDADTKNINDYIDLARKNPQNKATRFYIYARWPRMSKGGKGVTYDRNNYGKANTDLTKITDYAQIDAWPQLWTRKYTGGYDGTEETRDYFETLTRQMRQKRPDIEIYMIPVGHVMYALNARMERGEIPGFKSIWDVYNDGIHLGPVGSYIVGVTFFATLMRAKPDNLPTAPYGSIDPKAASIIQQTVWSIVSQNDLTGVKAAVSRLR